MMISLHKPSKIEDAPPLQLALRRLRRLSRKQRPAIHSRMKRSMSSAISPGVGYREAFPEI
jgi:hypothetical protein